jgi:hypothetical protein
MSRVPCMVARRGGRFLAGDVERRGVKQQTRATTKAYTGVLASSSRRGTHILGKLWQLRELPVVSCYAGQGIVRGSENASLPCCMDVTRNRSTSGETVCRQGPPSASRMRILEYPTFAVYLTRMKRLRRRDGKLTSSPGCKRLFLRAGGWHCWASRLWIQFETTGAIGRPNAMPLL